MAGKPSTLTRGDGRNQDGGCTGGINGQTPCKVGASVFGAPGTSCDEYPYASTREGAASGNPSILRCIPAEENSSGDRGFNLEILFDVGFVWGQPIYNNAGIQTGTNPPVPAVAVQMCYAHPTQRVNDGREFRMVLTTQLWRRATSVFRRKTAELQEITAERKSTVVEPLWVKTANNLTMMVYSDVKLGSPVWSDGEDGKDKVVRIIKPSDSDYPPKQSTKKATGNESDVRRQ
ncbi:uncharacterized protein EV420DRAFT_1562577 [Desarmillaria tabescens]|uniref:Deoxyribonuclease NucA/NucB domain-containing protein n=1 Tax=Armillaria tabescens TaxID=1929756 RepID=A0AA39MYI9_ARMTA|nr:uncharacterized protein EV420DRAFT_1562577 [Desarmillaria tabescens]KAK0450590.1 hypothetical protein EV420DRAFT_1562577 [Desarmillaria tabescens]